MTYTRLEIRPEVSPRKFFRDRESLFEALAGSGVSGRMVLDSARALVRCFCPGDSLWFDAGVTSLMNNFPNAVLPDDFRKIAGWVAGNRTELESGQVLEPFVLRIGRGGLWAPVHVVSAARLPNDEPRIRVTVEGIAGPFTGLRSVHDLTPSACFVFLRECGGSTWKETHAPEDIGGMHLTAWLHPVERRIQLQYVYASDAQKAINRAIRLERKKLCTRYLYNCRCFPCPIGRSGERSCPYSRHETTYPESECRVIINGKRHLGFIVSEGLCLSCIAKGRATPYWKHDQELRKKKYFGKHSL